MHKFIKFNKFKQIGQTHVLKHDFLATLRGGSSSSSNEGGCDDWPSMDFWDDNSRSSWSMLLKIRSFAS